MLKQQTLRNEKSDPCSCPLPKSSESTAYRKPKVTISYASMEQKESFGNKTVLLCVLLVACRWRRQWNVLGHLIRKTAQQVRDDMSGSVFRIVLAQYHVLAF